MASRLSVFLLALAACGSNQLIPNGVGGGGGSAVGGGFGGSFGEGGGSFCFTAVNETETPVVAQTPPPPVSGGTLLVLPDQSIAVADPDRDRVTFVRPDDTFRSVALQPRDEPGRVALGPDGLVLVALRGAGAVAALDPVTSSVVARFSVCAAPRGLAWSPKRQVLAVACATGDLTELTLANRAVVASVTTHPADDLRDVYDADGDLYLSTFRDAHVLRRGVEGTVTAMPSPGPKVLDDQGVEVGPDAGFAFGVKTFAPHVAWRMVPTATGAVMVHQRAQVDPVQAPGCGSAYGGPAFVGTGIVHTVVAKLTADGVEDLALVRRAAVPVDVAVSADEQHVAIASLGGLFIDSAATVLPLTDGEVTAVGWVGQTLVVFDRRHDALARYDAAGNPKKVVALHTVFRDVASTGHRLFHAPTANAIACASCHPEGGEDGHVWSLSEGLRRTPTLRGGLKGTEPFHWSGDLATMKALTSEVMAKRMGGASQSDPRAQALLDWVDSVPKLPAPSGLDAAAVARGQQLFSSAALGCGSCHGGTLGTNNATVAVGTGEALQVPRLTELAWRAPYFHDGRVPTLAARFTFLGGGDAHGNVSQLTPAQVDDLVAYLRSR